MKKLIMLFATLFVFVSVFAIGPTNTESVEEELLVEEWMTKSFFEEPVIEIIYVNSELEYEIIDEIIKQIKKLNPDEFKNIYIIIRINNDIVTEEPLEYETWMSEDFNNELKTKELCITE